MRIRKHASKILGSASCQAWLSSPAPCADDPAPQHGELCELNQSPWDVLPSPQLPDFHLSDRPHLKVEDDDDEDDDDDNDRIILSLLPRKKKKNTNKKNNKKDLKKAMSNDRTCNKSDGKGWRCKKPVQPPHTLCHYHLAQLRSYNAAYRAPSTAGAVANRRRKPVTGGLTDNGGDFYYYYSGFGPWRGKRRSGETVVDDDDDEEEEEEEVHVEEEDDDVNGVEEDGISDDGDEEEELEEKKKKSGSVCRKRGRRRIKARSLKSLL